MSLSGRKCREKTVWQNQNYPRIDIVTAIHSKCNLNRIFHLIRIFLFFLDYMQKIWDEAVITEKQINSAICAKLIGCHNLKKKISQKPKSQPSNSITTAVGSDVE
jgi:hypothetical protein